MLKLFKKYEEFIEKIDIESISEKDIKTSENSSEITFTGRDKKKKKVTIEGDERGTIARELVKQHNDKSNIVTLNESMDILKIEPIFYEIIIKKRRKNNIIT